jgi:hypothetical protein
MNIKIENMYTIYYGIKPNGEPKVGCDSNYPARAIKYELTNYRILEEHEDIMIASYREVDLQIELIGKRDSNAYYFETVERSVKGGNTAFRKRKGIHGYNEEERKLNSSNAGKHCKGISKNNGPRNSSPLQITQSKIAQTFATEAAKRKIVCEHCNEPFSTGMYTRWHGSRCPKNPINN